MAVPEISTPITRGVALMLRDRTRNLAAAGATYTAVNASFALAPAGPYTAALGSFSVVPYTTITATVTGLSTGSYVARGTTPGQDPQPWSAPLAITTGTPGVFSNVPVLVGTGASITVAPAGLENAVIWRSATFNVSAAMSLSSTAGADSLIITLKTVVNNAAAANISVDWGDGTGPVSNTVAYWVNSGNGRPHTYTGRGTYTIRCTATTSGAAAAGVAMLVVPVSGAVLTAWYDSSVPLRAHAKITVSPTIVWTDALLGWGDSSGQTVTSVQAGDVPHDYFTAGTYTLTTTLNTGDSSTTTVGATMSPSLVQADQAAE